MGSKIKFFTKIGADRVDVRGRVFAFLNQSTAGDIMYHRFIMSLFVREATVVKERTRPPLPLIRRRHPAALRGNPNRRLGRQGNWLYRALIDKRDMPRRSRDKVRPPRDTQYTAPSWFGCKRCGWYTESKL